LEQGKSRKKSLLRLKLIYEACSSHSQASSLSSSMHTHCMLPQLWQLTLSPVVYSPHLFLSLEIRVSTNSSISEAGHILTRTNSVQEARVPVGKFVIGVLGSGNDAISVSITLQNTGDLTDTRTVISFSDMGRP
jgi:hypothetical protein